MSKNRAARSAAAAAALALVAGILLGACTNQNATLGVSVVPAPQAQVSFSTHVRPILSNAGCTASGCHGGSPTSANLSLERIFDPVDGAVGVTSCEASPLLRIEPFNSSASYLIRKLEGTQQSSVCTACNTVIGPVNDCGMRMPFGLPALQSADIKTIRDWIDQGAKDN